MTITKLYYLNSGTEVTLICEMDGYAPDERWIDSITWNESEYNFAENALIQLYITKNLKSIHQDFYDMADQARKEAIDDYWESQIP